MDNIHDQTLLARGEHSIRAVRKNQWPMVRVQLRNHSVQLICFDAAMRDHISRLGGDLPPYEPRKLITDVEYSGPDAGLHQFLTKRRLYVIRVRLTGPLTIDLHKIVCEELEIDTPNDEWNAGSDLLPFGYRILILSVLRVKNIIMADFDSVTDLILLKISDPTGDCFNRHSFPCVKHILSVGICYFLPSVKVYTILVDQQCTTNFTGMIAQLADCSRKVASLEYVSLRGIEDGFLRTNGLLTIGHSITTNLPSCQVVEFRGITTWEQSPFVIGATVASPYASQTRMKDSACILLSMLPTNIVRMIWSEFVTSAPMARIDREAHHAHYSAWYKTYALQL